MRLEKHLRKVVGYCCSQRDKAIVGNAAYQEYAATVMGSVERVFLRASKLFQRRRNKESMQTPQRPYQKSAGPKENEGLDR
jgi:hypothetical protein